MSWTTLFALAALYCQGCFIPPQHELEVDGGGNFGKPVIDRDKVIPSGSSGWEFTLLQKASAFGFEVLVLDSDKETMYGRMFVDFNYKTVVDQSTVQAEGKYQLRFLVPGLCDQVVNNEPGKHIVSIVVSDEPFVDSGDDLSMVRNGGGRDEVNWTMTCVEVGGDAGI